VFSELRFVFLGKYYWFFIKGFSNENKECSTLLLITEIIFIFVLMKLIRFLLFQISSIYVIVNTVRNFFFDVGVFKSTSFAKPIIAVGNLSVGGTGKTPQIEYLIKLLKDDFKVGVLSRGYGRKTNGFLVADNQSFAEKIGDEPLQFFQKFNKITVAVDEQRVRGIQQLETMNEVVEVILLDDAFQHRKVTAGFYVVLTKFDELFSNDFILPTGNLRERRKGVGRANVVVVTKCPSNLSDIDQKETKQLIERYFSGPIFFSTINYSTILKSNAGRDINTSDLNAYEVLLVTGIANPKPLLEHLSSLNCKFKHVSFSDHHHFTSAEIFDLKQQFELMKSKNKIMLTTEKDFVRLSNSIEELHYLEIETKFINQQNEFDRLITNYVKSTL
jgi:tetraacyldisaccharide 4'-kinase